MKKSVTMGQIFKVFQRTPENLENVCVFVTKSLEMGTFLQNIPKYGYLFFEKVPQTLGMGLELLEAHLQPIQI